MLGNNLDRAVVLDLHDATANSLPVGQIDEDAVTGSPVGLWLVHQTRMRRWCRQV